MTDRHKQLTGAGGILKLIVINLFLFFLGQKSTLQDERSQSPRYLRRTRTLVSTIYDVRNDSVINLYNKVPSSLSHIHTQNHVHTEKKIGPSPQRTITSMESGQRASPHRMSPKSGLNRSFVPCTSSFVLPYVYRSRIRAFSYT